MAYAFAARILPGQTEACRRFAEESLGPRRAGNADLQRRAGITEEEYWLQREPDGGDLLIVVSNRDYALFDAIMANPETDFDRWMRGQLRAIFGPAPGGPAAPPNELLGRWP